MKMLDGSEVAKHNSRASCWVVIRGEAYDVTEFLDDHPGGAAIILQYGGKDATEEYELVHPPNTIENTLSKDKHLGPVEPSTIVIPKAPTKSNGEAKSGPTPLEMCVSLDDIENAAASYMSERAYTYFHSAADTLHSLRNNREDWEKITLRPRILIDVRKADMRRRMMGFNSSLPFFIAPAAMAKLGDPEGEMHLVRGAVAKNIPYCVSTYSSVAHLDLTNYLKSNSGGTLFFQLYVAKGDEETRNRVVEARKLGYKALVITVDTAVVGKREEDDRYKAKVALAQGTYELPSAIQVTVPPPTTDAPILNGVHSSSLNWKDLKWIREAWGDTGPVAIKGIQTAEDARLACEAGVDAIYLSNHGGRQIDSGPSSIRTLLEIRMFCPEILNKCEVYLDGGVRRGADVIKALCLGATGVALGRPFMYALSVHQTRGVVKAIQILSDEIETTMRLMGVTSLDQLKPEYVNATRLYWELPQALPAFPPLQSKL